MWHTDWTSTLLTNNKYIFIFHLMSNLNGLMAVFTLDFDTENVFLKKHRARKHGMNNTMNVLLFICSVCNSV